MKRWYSLKLRWTDDNGNHEKIYDDDREAEKARLFLLKDPKNTNIDIAIAKK